jgi:hypothetical protein
MAQSQWQWNPDGSAIVFVNGRQIRIAPGGASPGQTITVAGQKVAVPAKPAPAPQVQPYLTPDQQQFIIGKEGEWSSLVGDADLALKQAGIQLNELDLPQIGLKAGQQEGAALEDVAGRGLEMSGVRDNALQDIERGRVLAETAARAAFQAVQDKRDAMMSRVENERINVENWKRATSGANAAMDNANIPPTGGTPETLKPPVATSIPSAQPGQAVGGPPRTATGPRLNTTPGGMIAPTQTGRSVIADKDQTVYTPGGRPIGMYEGAPRGWTVSLTPGGRVRYTRSEVPKVKTR